MENSIIEIWKPVLGYEGKYEASSLGRIRSLNHLGSPGRMKVLKPSLNNNGYLVIIFCKNGKVKGFPVQRVIYSAFLGPIPEGMTVDHVNNDKRDNRLENLQLLTRGDNARKSNLGRQLSDEHKAKLKGRTPWMKGRKHTEESKRKMTSSKKGQIPWNKGKSPSVETRAKISATLKARYQREKN